MGVVVWCDGGVGVCVGCGGVCCWWVCSQQHHRFFGCVFCELSLLFFPVFFLVCFVSAWMWCDIILLWGGGVVGGRWCCCVYYTSNPSCYDI